MIINSEIERMKALMRNSRPQNEVVTPEREMNSLNGEMPMQDLQKLSLKNLDVGTGTPDNSQNTGMVSDFTGFMLKNRLTNTAFDVRLTPARFISLNARSPTKLSKAFVFSGVYIRTHPFIVVARWRAFGTGTLFIVNLIISQYRKTNTD